MQHDLSHLSRAKGIERLQQFELWRHAENAKRLASEEKRRERLQSEASQRQEEAAKRSSQAPGNGP